MKVYNILGKEIATLVNQQLSPGTYSVDWDASAFQAEYIFMKLNPVTTWKQSE